MKIDFHVHITPPEIIKNPQKIKRKEKYFSLLSKNPHNKYACAEDIIAALDESQFDHAVVFGFAFKDLGLCRFVNDYVIESVKKYPQKLTGFISVSPNARGAEKEIERCYNAGLCGIGELYPDGQGFNIDNEKETRAVVNTCIAMGIPLILHTNEPVGHDYIGKNNVSLKKIECFISNSRNLNIILAHWGGGIFIYETMKEIKDNFKNVYYDTAATPFLYGNGIYDSVKTLGLTDKILFGSDYPLLPQKRYMDGIEKSCLSTDDKKCLLGLNAKKLLKMGV